ncbi:copia protein [Tanacetum coccineum]
MVLRIKILEKATENATIHGDIVLKGTQNVAPLKKEIDDINKEISVNYGHSKISLDQTKHIIDDKLCYIVACDIMNGNDDPELTSVIECQSRHDWNKWKEAMQDKLNSLNKRKVFRRIVLTPGVVKPISLLVFEILDMRLMDVVTAYLYGSLDSDIYMKILKGFKIPKALSKTIYEFVIIAVYVDDLNIIGTNKEINEVVVHLKEEFEMKDLAKSLSTLMVGRLLNVDNDPFQPCEEDQDVLGPEVPYLSAIGALMYLTNCTRPDISFAVNLLARFSSSPTKRHWNGIKHIFRYLRGTTDLGLFYSNNSKQGLVGYADASYLSDPHKARSQTGYVFLNGGTTISWRSQKQTLVATSSNHAEVIALHEASRECVWLRSMTQLIVTSCGLNVEKSPTIIHEDNAACVTQMKEGYIKSDRTKHIPPRYFAYTQDLIKDNQIEMKYVQSSNNSADLFTKALPTSVFKKHIHAIGMRHVQKT